MKARKAKPTIKPKSLEKRKFDNLLSFLKLLDIEQPILKYILIDTPTPLTEEVRNFQLENPKKAINLINSETHRSDKSTHRAENLNLKVCISVQKTISHKDLDFRKYLFFKGDRSLSLNRTEKDFKGYQFLYFDIDKPTTLTKLKTTLGKYLLLPFVRAIVETSPNKFHVYIRFNTNYRFYPHETSPTARLDGELIPLSEAKNYTYKTLWHSINNLLEGDPTAIQKLKWAQAPYYRNPKSNFIARLAYKNENAPPLNNKMAYKLLKARNALTTIKTTRKRNPRVNYNTNISTHQEYITLYKSHTTLNLNKKNLTGKRNEYLLFLCRYAHRHIDINSTKEHEKYYENIIKPYFKNKYSNDLHKGIKKETLALLKKTQRTLSNPILDYKGHTNPIQGYTHKKTTPKETREGYYKLLKDYLYDTLNLDDEKVLYLAKELYTIAGGMASTQTKILYTKSHVTYKFPLHSLEFKGRYLKRIKEIEKLGVLTRSANYIPPFTKTAKLLGRGSTKLWEIKLRKEVEKKNKLNRNPYILISGIPQTSQQTSLLERANSNRKSNTAPIDKKIPLRDNRALELRLGDNKENKLNLNWITLKDLQPYGEKKNPIRGKREVEIEIPYVGGKRETEGKTRKTREIPYGIPYGENEKRKERKERKENKLIYSKLLKLTAPVKLGGSLVFTSVGGLYSSTGYGKPLFLVPYRSGAPPDCNIHYIFCKLVFYKMQNYVCDKYQEIIIGDMGGDYYNLAGA